MHKQTAQFIGVVTENLPNISNKLMQNWIEKPRELQRVLKNALCPTETIPIFPVWKTIKRGPNLDTADTFSKAIKAKGMEIGDWAKDIMSKPDFIRSITETNSEQEYDLFQLTTAQLTGTGAGTTAEVFAGIERLKFEKCPAWMGPKVRLDYLDQPNGEVLIIAMNPITDSDGNLKLFGVRHDGHGLWLYGSYGEPDYVWNSDTRFVFACRK